MGLLDRVGVASQAGKMPSQLSGGQQQRVAIARAVVTHPGVVLADEPTAGLDPEAAADVLALLGRLHQAGNTVVLITHDRAAAAQAQRRHYLKNGELSG